MNPTELRQWAKRRLAIIRPTTLNNVTTWVYASDPRPTAELIRQIPQAHRTTYR